MPRERDTPERCTPMRCTYAVPAYHMATSSAISKTLRDSPTTSESTSSSTSCWLIGRSVDYLTSLLPHGAGRLPGSVFLRMLSNRPYFCRSTGGLEHGPEQPPGYIAINEPMIQHSQKKKSGSLWGPSWYGVAKESTSHDL